MRREMAAVVVVIYASCLRTLLAARAPVPGLFDQTLSEEVVELLCEQSKPSALIDAASRLEHVWLCDLKGRILGSPALVENHLYLGGEGSAGELPGALLAVDRRGGSILWRFEIGATVRSSPTVVGNSIWFGVHDGKIRRLRNSELSFEDP